MTGCQSKDPKYERLLIEKYAAILMTVSRRYSRTRTEAEDVLQDSFIKIFEHIAQYKSERGTLLNWMRTIVIRTALRDYRKKYPPPENIEDINDHAQNTYRDIIEKLEEEDLLKIINKLPGGYRQVFNLYVIDGCSHREIGELLHITESTSRSQLARAKKILKNKLKKYKNTSICTTTNLVLAFGLN